MMPTGGKCVFNPQWLTKMTIGNMIYITSCLQ